MTIFHWLSTNAIIDKCIQPLALIWFDKQLNLPNHLLWLDLKYDSDHFIKNIFCSRYQVSITNMKSWVTAQGPTAQSN
jgi:hypothetical protein